LERRRARRRRIANYLSDKNMMKWEDMSGGISITDYGVDVVEDALAHPTLQPTADFLPSSTSSTSAP
jgi:hypothetical protein